MEWDSPWGRGAPGWHIECSVMSAELLGHPFDIHTGGIDHREIHHPNEIAQNQAHGHSADSGARIWMHNNFLIDRRGKMSKSSGEFLVMQTLVERGYHPLAYRLMCLQAHYRSELEFSWEGLGAALTRLKRLVMAIASLRAGALPAGEPGPRFADYLARFDAAVSDDLNTAVALTVVEEVAALKKADAGEKLAAIAAMDAVLGLNLLELERTDLRIRPVSATITQAEIEASLAARREARAAKDFARSDALRDDLAAKGVEVMDGDPLGWEWKLG
jgi:cysteinyl-tRNA synthetase